MTRLAQEQENMKLFQFLLKLNEDFEGVCSNLVPMDPLPNLNKAYYLVQQVENQRQVTNIKVEPTTFFSSNPNSILK